MNFTLGFQDYLLFFVGVFNFLMSIFILVNNPKNKVNLAFTLFSFFLTVWTVLLLLFLRVPFEYAAVIMRGIYVAGIGIAVALWNFVYLFPQQQKLSGRTHTFLFLATTLVCIVLLWPGGIVREAIMLPNGTRSIVLNSWGYFLFASYFSFFYCGALYLFGRRLTQVDTLLKKQSIPLLTGMIIAVIFGGYFNIILPSPFFHNYLYIALGPFFTLFIVSGVGYAVAKFQFMNIKAVVTEMSLIMLILALLADLVFAPTVGQIVFRLVVVMVVTIFGLLLIRSVLDEIKQREEITTLAESLEQANTQLQELDRQKTDFLSIAAHQLRTPLSIINGYIELIKDGGYGKVGKKMRDTLDNMDESNARLTKLVDEFLDITRIEQGRTKFTFKEADISKVITSAVEELRDRGEQKGLKIKWTAPKKQITPSFDDEKVRHVIFNFIDNAIKYSTKGSITVGLAEDETGVSVTVTDNGLGFNKIDEANFFQKFYRGENVKGINVTGTGLGLYVCRKFIETHGGRIWAHSQGLGKGSEFGFWIPMVHKNDPSKDDETIAKEPISSATFTA